MPRHNDEIDKLKQDVGDLKTVVRALASALDKVSENEGVLSDTVGELVQTQRESLGIQEKLAKTSLSHSEKLEQIDSGIKKILNRLGPPDK